MFRMLKIDRAQTASIAALLLLSLLWAAGMLRADLLPGLFPTFQPHLQRLAFLFSLLAAASGMAAALRRDPWPRGRLLWQPVLIGVGLFVLPAGLAAASNGNLPGLARAALFTLVPVFALVFEPYVDTLAEPQSRGGLLAALAAVAGALCIFPVAIPASIATTWGFCAVVLAAACIGLTSCKAAAVARAAPALPITAIAALTAAVVFAVASALTEKPVWYMTLPDLLWLLLVDVPGLMLLFWLLHRMSAVRLSTRYLVAPLFAILAGAGLMRAPLEPRTWFGLALMAGGAAYLLLAPAAKTESSGLALR
jgi:drug/metabolite transporter (DMT)-like permease